MYSHGNKYCFDRIGKIVYLASEHGESVNTKKAYLDLDLI